MKHSVGDDLVIVAREYGHKLAIGDMVVVDYVSYRQQGYIVLDEHGRTHVVRGEEVKSLE